MICLPTASCRRPSSTVARARPLWFALLLALASAITLSFLFLPVLAIFVNTGWGRLVSSLGNSQSTDALRLSLETTAIATAVIALVGTPAAYALATRSFPGKAVVLERDGQHGVAEGLDPSGALRVRTADGETTLVQIDEATFAS